MKIITKKMKPLFLMLLAFACSQAVAQTDSTTKPEPFSNGDYTWINGNDRRTEAVLKTKYFTGDVMVDANYNYSFNNPIDNTVVGSTALARHNELQLTLASFGAEFNYKGARAKIKTQFGTRSTVVPRNDFSVYRGQYDLANIYRYLSEAYGGYHWNKWHGINFDVGMFMSYIGLFSYYNVENWAYQPSFTSDNTPWFFNGARIQAFPKENLKVELWLINGWQSYGKFNSMPGIGAQVLYRPKEHIQVLTNNYYGTDAAGIPQRKRFHTDNSFLLRYYNRPTAKGLSKMAFSVTADLGFETGGGVSGFNNSNPAAPAQYFVSAMAYNRTWFAKDKLAWTLGGGFMYNPGRYLVLLPTGQASALPNPLNPTQAAGAFPFTANPGDQFTGWDASTNLDWMPNQSITFRLELVYRNANVPYFAGRGGVTSQTGFITNALDPAWRPDLVKNETRLIFAMLFRI